MIPVCLSYGIEKIPHMSCYPMANPRCEVHDQVHAYLNQFPKPDKIRFKN